MTVAAIDCGTNSVRLLLALHGRTHICSSRINLGLRRWIRDQVSLGHAHAAHVDTRRLLRRRRAQHEFRGSTTDVHHEGRRLDQPWWQSANGSHERQCRLLSTRDDLRLDAQPRVHAGDERVAVAGVTTG